MDFITPQELAEKTGWSLRRLKAKAREIGACRILGNRMVLTPEDVESILEACRPAAVEPLRHRLTGTYDDLVRLRAQQRKGDDPKAAYDAAMLSVGRQKAKPRRG